MLRINQLNFGIILEGIEDVAAAPDIILEHQETSGTDGGTATSGSWATRTLNTELRDVNSDCSLASNQFTLSAGSYYIEAEAAFYETDFTRLRIYNATGTAVVVNSGVNMVISNAGEDDDIATVRGVFTVASSQALELQSRVTQTKLTDGWGRACSFDTELYAQVRLWKL